MCDDGEFLHINDLTLLIKEDRQFCVNALSNNESIEDPDLVAKRMIIRYKERIELLDSLLNKIRKGDSYA
jgi:hypothetical protein